MSAAVVAETEKLLTDEAADVRPYEAADTDLPPIFWPEGEVPASVVRQPTSEEVQRAAGAAYLAPATVPCSVSARINTANCSRSRRAGHWFRQKRLDWRDGYRILLRIETRFWDARDRIPEVQKILASCRRLVLAEMGYRVS
ncbi:MAG TPA: hypothetical protein VNJ52_04715 [Patescibacteria group bacterium]|nr:hypothetical protein [Patescibacteria group bacterium]